MEGKDGDEKEVNVDSDEEVTHDDIKVDTEEINLEESNNTELEPCERSTSKLSEASDITLAFDDMDDNTEDTEDVSDNTLEEISAL